MSKQPLDPSLEEMYAALEMQPPGGPDVSEETLQSWRVDHYSQIAAIYWYANLNHAGLWSSLYSVLCTSPYTPGNVMQGPESEGELCIEAYNKLCDAFGGEPVEMDLDTHEDEYDDEDEELTPHEQGLAEALDDHWSDDNDTVEDGLSALAKDLNEFRRQFSIQTLADSKFNVLAAKLEQIVDGAIGLAETAEAQRPQVSSVNPDDATLIAVALKTLEEGAKHHINSVDLFNTVQGYRDTIYGLIEALKAHKELADSATATARRLCEHVAAAIKQVEAIVCTEGQDAGVIFKSWDSPTHIEMLGEPPRPCTVYNLPYFSELGGALVELYRTLKHGPKCTQDKGDGQIYTCDDAACPVHGERNKTLAAAFPVEPAPRRIEEGAGASQVDRFIIHTDHAAPMYLNDWQPFKTEHGEAWSWTPAQVQAYQFQDPTKIRDTLAKLRAAGFQVITELYTPVQE